jgi:sigma-B regulation protein RsbU (phosphoserine phosphatase)
MKPVEHSGIRVTDRLAAQIDMLQEAFRTLSTASTLKDLAGRFIAIVRRVYAGSDVCILHRAMGSDIWQDPANVSSRYPADFLPLPVGSGTVASLDEGSTEIRVVLKLVDQSYAGVVISDKLTGTSFDEADLIAARMFAHLFDNAYQAMLSRRNEKELNFSLNHRVLQLNSLIDTGIEVAKLDQDITPEQMALQRAASLTNAARGTVTVTAANGHPRMYSFPEGTDSAAPLIVTAQTGQHQIISSFSFGGNSYQFALHNKESRSGPVAFDETDQLLLDALARQVHASLENRYLHAQALEKQKIEQDLAVAASIQQRILPTDLPVIEGYDIAGINIPSKAVGGDYYDCIALPDGRVALVIADVSGKGIPAALLVSSLHAYLSAYIETGIPLRELAGRLNRVIGHASTEDKFITAFLGVLTPGTGEFESLNAGHTSTFVIRTDNTVQELSAGGIPFGMLDMDFPFQTEIVTLQSGDRLLLYTDGVTEAMNEKGDLFDQAVPIKDFASQHKPSGAGNFIHELIGQIKRFTGTAEQNDDITALYLLRR